VLADAAARKSAFYGALAQAHMLSASAGLLLMGVAALAVMSPIISGLAIGHVGAPSIALGILYFAAARLLYAVEVRATPAMEKHDAHPGVSLRSAIVKCIVAGAAVTAAGALIAVSADRISEEAGISQSAMGVLFVGAATSLPEIVSVLAAIRLNAYDLAAGNLFGSNMFNILVLVVDDVTYLEGPLLRDASPSLAATAVVAMMMTGVVMAAMRFAREKRMTAIDSAAGVVLFILYALNVWLIAAAGTA